MVAASIAMHDIIGAEQMNQMQKDKIRDKK